MTDEVPSWAAEPAASGIPDWANTPAPAQKHEGGVLERLGHDLHGAFMSADLNGFGGLVARKGFEWSGYGIDKLKAAYPGRSDDWYKQQQKKIINQSVIEERQKAGQEQEDNAFNVGTEKHHFDPLAFGAAVVGGADPTYAINPGAGVAKALAVRGAKGLATRVAANAAAHAAFGAETDAAYQGADIVDGIQKDFDIKRNLTAAATQGAFGAAHPVVSDFVAGLFKARGVDTLPPHTPEGITKPLTGQGLSPEETAHYHEVLQTGDEKAIRGFFDGRNVKPPSWAETHEWVGRRDAVQQGHAPEDFADPMFHPEPGPPDLRSAVQQHIAMQTSHWKNAPEFEVINHVDDIKDPQVKAAAVAEGADHPDALGFLGPDGKVRIFADRIDSHDTLNSVIYHEALGHFGLQQQFGDRLDATLGTLLKRNVGQFGKDVDEWQKANPGAYDGDRIRAAEEVMANMSNNGTLKKSVADAVVAHVRNFGRKMGMKLSYSDAEVRTILSMAHEAVVNGHGRDARANGFRYMFSGEKSAVHDPLAKQNTDEMLQQGRDPNEVRQLTGGHYADDGQYRSEISDDGASLLNEHRLYGEGEHKLGDVLHHPRLYEAYPELKNTKVKVGEFKHGYDGAYDPIDRTIYVDHSAPDKKTTLIHEVQHAVQHIEERPGMESGAGTVNMSHEDYMGNPLEKEAYSTQDRIGQSGLERRQGDVPKFMRRSDLEPKDVAEQAYDRLDKEYTPRYRSWEDAKSAAEHTALSPAAVRESRSVGNLDRKIFVYDAAAKEANEILSGLAKKAKDGILTAEDHALGIETAAHFNYVLGRLENDSAQIARGLNAMKAVSFSRNNLTRLKKALEEGDTNMDALSDPDTMLKFLKQYGEMSEGNPAGAAEMLKSVTKPYWWQYVLSYRQNMMLSGLSTHLKAVMDMSTTAGRELQEVALAMPGAAVRESLRSMGMKGIQPGVHPTELAARLWGLTRAGLEAKTYADTFNSLKHGNSQPRYANVADPRIPIVSKVSDMISAQDTFFRSFLNNQNLYALGARKALQDFKRNNEKYTWDDVMTQGAAYARNPTQGMLAEAHELTENTILMNRSPINAAIDKARAIRPNMSGWEQFGSFMANMLTPFIRVSSNALLNQVIRRSPLAFLDPLSRADWHAGGARRDIVIARVALGTALIGSYWAAADPKKDKLTGNGPDDYNKIRELEASGWAPNAVHENGRYNQNSNLNISLNPFDKHNATATMVAGLREAWEKGTADKGQLVTGFKLAMISVLHDFASQSFVNDIQPAVDAAMAKGSTASQKIGQFAADEAKSFLPNATSQLTRILDPNKRDTRSDSITETVANTVKASIPGLEKSLPIRYNVYGQPMKTGTSVTGIHTWLSTGNGQDEVTDKTEKELARLGKLTKAAIVTATPRTIKVEGVSLKLDTDQAEEYQKYAGQTLVQAIRDQIESGEWQKLSDQDKVNEVRTIQTQAKSQVRDALLEKEGWLKPAQISNLRSQLSGQ